MGDVPYDQETQQSRPHVQWPGMDFMHVPTNYVLCLNLRSICFVYGLLGSMLQVCDHTTFILCYCLHSRYGTRWITWTCARGKQLLGGPYKWFLYTMGALMLCIGTCYTFPCAQRMTSLRHCCSGVFAYFFTFSLYCCRTTLCCYWYCRGLEYRLCVAFLDSILNFRQSVYPCLFYLQPFSRSVS